MKFQPINGHVQVKLVKHEEFIATAKTSYEEIGEVLSVCPSLIEVNGLIARTPLHAGDKVYFDSWLAAKYPSGVEGEFYWLVPFKNIRAVEYGTDK